MEYILKYSVPDNHIGVLTNFTFTSRGLISVQHSILNVKALDSTFNQEKALVDAFSVIVKTDGSFAALASTLNLAPTPTFT